MVYWWYIYIFFLEWIMVYSWAFIRYTKRCSIARGKLWERSAIAPNIGQQMCTRPAQKPTKKRLQKNCQTGANIFFFCQEPRKYFAERDETKRANSANFPSNEQKTFNPEKSSSSRNFCAFEGPGYMNGTKWIPLGISFTKSQTLSWGKLCVLGPSFF